MNKSENEILNDELIGEAVLSLLKSKGPITTQSLLTALKAMESAERNDARRQALAGIIEEIGGMADSHNGAYDRDRRADSRNNGFPTFEVGTTRPGGKKMH